MANVAIQKEEAGETFRLMREMLRWDPSPTAIAKRIPVASGDKANAWTVR